jgi:hypothetical protein
MGVADVSSTSIVSSFMELVIELFILPINQKAHKNKNKKSLQFGPSTHHPFDAFFFEPYQYRS